MHRKMDVVSLRGDSSHCAMKVLFDAETELADFYGGRLIVPNLEWRSWFFRNNRIARNIRQFIPSIGQKLLPDVGLRVFLFFMGPHHQFDELLCDPRRKTWVYLFDVWEPAWPAIETWMRTWSNIGCVWFASSQAADHFHPRVPFPVAWLAQAADSTEFVTQDIASFQARNNTVFNIGRSHGVLTEFFKNFSSRHHLTYLHEISDGQTLFERRSDWIANLCRSKIVVVHPRNLSHPNVTGSVSMLTARYFEAYNSGAIVCGLKPTSGEFDRVLQGFPFIVYRDAESFERELLAALADPSPWQTARKRIRREHNWQARLAHITTELV